MATAEKHAFLIRGLWVGQKSPFSGRLQFFFHPLAILAHVRRTRARAVVTAATILEHNWQGHRYDITGGEGRSLFRQIQTRVRALFLSDWRHETRDFARSGGIFGGDGGGPKKEGLAEGPGPLAQASRWVAARQCFSPGAAIPMSTAAFRSTQDAWSTRVLEDSELFDAVAVLGIEAKRVPFGECCWPTCRNL